MKKILFSIFALFAVVMSASAVKIYIDPGHGGWNADSRNLLTIGHPTYNDTCGFWESNTNLWKSWYFEKKLKDVGYTVKKSRNSCFYGSNRELHVIAQESQSFGSDYFVSVHSNAHDLGKTTNYPSFFIKGYTGNESTPGSIAGCKSMWPYIWDIWAGGMEYNTAYSATNMAIIGGMSMNGWDYGVLNYQSRPSTLAEGYFHTYQPACHRALNTDWCRQEGLRFARGIKKHFGTAGESKGYIMGYIRTKEKEINQNYYNTSRRYNDVYYPINGAQVVLRNEAEEVIKTDNYDYAKSDAPNRNKDIYTTDDEYNGVFVYDDLTPGKYTIYVYANGYKNYEGTVTVTADKTTYTQIFLSYGQGTPPDTKPRDPDVEWELNGGRVPGGEVPTLEELWTNFKGYYTTYYNESRADQEISGVSTFMTKGCKIMTDEKSEYKWLGDYIMEVSAAQGYTLTNDPTADGMEALWRWSVHAFFNCNKHDSWPYTADFSTAGKQSAWKQAYLIGTGSTAELPWRITVDSYTIPTPVKDGYVFMGWYDKNDLSGKKYTTLTKGWQGKLYAIWEEDNADVKWQLNGGSVSVTLPREIKDAPYTIPTPTKTAYIFLGWYDKNETSGNKLTVLPVGYKGTVYALWRESKVTWELNGGELPKAAEVPTNDSLWTAFKPYYNTYYGLSRADQPITAVSTFAAAKMCEIMTKSDSEYKWLGDYVSKVASEQGVTLSTDPAGEGVEGAWRWAVHAFFNATTGQHGAAGTDFTTAGKPEKWGPAYQAKYGKGTTLPTKITSAYTIPTPTKNGTSFVGWYDTNNTTGNKLTVLPVGYDGTVYAIWNDMLGDVTWELNGGKVSVTLPNKIEGSAYTLPTPTKEGYVFLGWYDNAKGEGTALTSLPVGYKGTVYAIWREAKVTWVLNGGKVVKEVTTTTPGSAGAKVPTQEELWTSFKEAAGLSTLGTLEEIKAAGEGQPHNSGDTPCACRVICAKLTAAEVQAAFGKSEWKWLQTYIMSVQSDLTDDLTAAAWRYAIAAFFLQSEHTSWPASANFAEAGKPEKWGPAYQEANGGAGTEGETKTEIVEVELPSKITGAPYEIPTPVKDNDEFIGWYDNNEGKGTALTVLPVGYDGTVYAIWKSMNTSTDVEQVVRPALDLDAPMYDVLGRRVDATYRGIIIQNGNKYLLR